MIDEQLSKIIGKPCIKTSAKKNRNQKLLDEIIQKPKKKLPTKLFYSDVIEEEIEKISKTFLKKLLKSQTYRVHLQ